jgi:hypothetical protein
MGMSGKYKEVPLDLANPGKSDDHAYAVREFRRLRRIAAQRFSGVAKTALILDPTVHDTPRHFACTNKSQVRVAPELSAEPPEVISAVLRHELGHVVVLCGYAKAARGRDAQERQADEIAERVYGKHISYDERGVQTLKAGTRPRPMGLR